MNADSRDDGLPVTDAELYDQLHTLLHHPREGLNPDPQPTGQQSLIEATSLAAVGWTDGLESHAILASPVSRAHLTEEWERRQPTDEVLMRAVSNPHFAQLLRELHLATGTVASMRTAARLEMLIEASEAERVNHQRQQFGLVPRPSNPRPGPRRRHGQRPPLRARHRGVLQQVAIVAVVLAVAAGSAVLFRSARQTEVQSPSSGQSSSSTQSTTVPPPAPVGSVEFLAPTQGATITSPATLRGTAQLPPGESLWLLLRPTDQTTYYVTTDAPITVTETGSWQSESDIGEGKCDEGKRFEIFAISEPAGGEIEQALPLRPNGQYSVRLEHIPDDSTTLGRVEFTLGSYTGTRTC